MLQTVQKSKRLCFPKIHVEPLPLKVVWKNGVCGKSGVVVHACSPNTQLHESAMEY